MSSYLKTIIVLFALLLGIFQCTPPENNTVNQNVVIQDFIWKGLNLYYLWQKDVPNLADNRFKNQNDLNLFLQGQTPENLFESLLYQHHTTDKFSYLFDDYTVLEQWLSGTSATNGIDYGLSAVSGNNNIFGWVRYVLPDSDAATKNIKRGMVFYAINNTTLTRNNYNDLLNLNTYTLQFADYSNGTLTPNGKEITVSKTTAAENPIHISTVITKENKRIGYLMYNGFYNEYDTQLNIAFGILKSEKVTDLVLDLRYNSGGSVQSAQRLASMITGQFTGKVFSKQIWNAKIQKYIIENEDPSELENKFVDKIDSTPINSLNMNTVYILTSANATASSSELIINGLKPYINVVQIGEKTVGKNVGSITLYDAIDFSKEKSNPAHKYAMQPIVVKTANANNFGEYQTGLLPDISYSEDVSNLGILGDENEPLLQIAINKITGLSTNAIARKKVIPLEHIKTGFNEMHLDIVPKGVLNHFLSQQK